MGSLKDDAQASQEIAELRAANTRLLRQLRKRADAREEWRQQVWDAMNAAALAQGPPTYVKPKVDKRKGREEVALFHTTDWQNGKLTHSYSMEVCRERAIGFAHKVIKMTDLHRLAFPVRKCVVMLGGDMCENVTIFPGQRWEVEAGAYAQVMHTAGIVSDLLVTLAGSFEQVDVHWCMGNHGRMARKGDHPKGDNLDRFIYGIAARQHPPNVTWFDRDSLEWDGTTPSWYKHVVIGEYKAVLTHGDLVGAATKTIQDKVNAWAAGVVDWFDDIYVGHRHHCKELEMPGGGRIFLDPSIESGSEYAAGQMAAVGTPRQRLNFIDPVKRRVTAEYLLDVG